MLRDSTRILRSGASKNHAAKCATVLTAIYCNLLHSTTIYCNIVQTLRLDDYSCVPYALLACPVICVGCEFTAIYCDFLQFTAIYYKRKGWMTTAECLACCSHAASFARDALRWLYRKRQRAAQPIIHVAS